MTSELRPAVAVICDLDRCSDTACSVAVIEADREAVRAPLLAEIERLKAAWEAQHRDKVKERAEAKLWFEQAQEAKAELAKWKALAETLAGKVDLFKQMLNDPAYPCEYCDIDCTKAADIIEAQAREIARLREALQFYARENSWKSCGMYMSGRPNPSSAEIDRGDKARAALGGTSHD